MTSTQPPRGMRDFLPDDVRRREHVMGVIRRVYERYGFEPLETPAAENIETLLGKYGEEGNKLIFKILRRGEHEDSGEADLALRYDLTVPLARVVAQYQARLPKFFKRYQIQPVWRADRPARGRFREFYQCDVDAIGSTSLTVEVEQLSAVSEALTTLGFDDFRIRLNHRQLLPLVLGHEDFFGLPESAHTAAIVALDKLDKVGDEGVAREMEERGLAERKRVAQALAGLRQAMKTGTVEAALEGLRNALSAPSKVPPSVVESALEGLRKAEPGEGVARPFQGRDRGAESPALRPSPLSLDVVIAQLRDLVRLCDSTPAAGRLVFDPFLARGLSYYTGAIMEVSVPGIGSLGGGGRYDNLIGMFLGRDVPACGFSLGLERIIVVMTERDMFPAAVAGGSVDVMVTIWRGSAEQVDPEAPAGALRLAAELRHGGLRVDVYPDADKLGKQLKYAASRGVPLVAVVGDDERARGEVTIKDLRNGEQTPVPRAQAADFIKARLHG